MSTSLIIEKWFDLDLDAPVAGGAGNDIEASGSLSITGAADLDATGTLLAAGSLSITGAADLDATGVLLAAGTLSITGAADLDATGSLLAAGSLAITGVADLDATGTLVAVGSLTINGAADLTSPEASDISASGSLSITGTADLDAIGSLTAAGSLTINGSADLDDGGVAPVADEAQTPAGRAKRRRKYIVEVDGQEFVVESAQQALALLDRATDLARKQAEKLTDEAERKALPKALKVGRADQIKVKAPVISGSSELKAELTQAEQRIRQIYEDAAIAAELRLLMALEQERDDEEDPTTVDVRATKPRGSRNKIVTDTEKRLPPAAGMGRPKGALNKTTRAAKEAFTLAFEQVGGADALATWACENRTEFYKLFARLIPTEVSGPDGNRIEFAVSHLLPPTALDK